MKKVLLVLAAIGLGLFAYAKAAPTVQFTPTILPQTSSVYEVGTSTRSYLRGTFDNLCLTGDSCITVWPTGGGSSLATPTIQSMFQGGNYNLWTSGNINASSSVTTNATTSNLVLSGITGSILAVDSNGKVIATTTSAGGVTAVNGSSPIVSSGGNTPSISLQGNFGALNVTTSGYVNASTSVLTSATTTNLTLTSATTTDFLYNKNGVILGNDNLSWDGTNILIPNNVRLQLGGGSGNPTGFKTGTDGTFLIDTGANQNIYFKAGDSAGVNKLAFTPDFTNLVWQVGSTGTTTQKGDLVVTPLASCPNTLTDSSGKFGCNNTAYQPLGSYLTTSNTSTVQSMSLVGLQGGSYNIWTSGFMNASSTRTSNATVTTLTLTGITGKLLAADSNGIVIATSSPLFSLSNGTNTTAAGNSVNLNSNLGVTKLWATTLEATTSNFTNLNASSSIFTNATTTGQGYFGGNTYFTGLASQNCLGTGVGGILQAGSCGGSSQSTSTIQTMFQGGSWNSWTSGFVNASTSIFTSATTTNLGITGITGKLLATDSSGVVIATSSPLFSLSSGTNTTAVGNTVNLNSSILGETLFSGTAFNATTGNVTNLSASGTVWTINLSATTTTTTNLSLTSLTSKSCLGTDASGVVINGTCGGSAQSTSTIQTMFQGGSWNEWTSGFQNASTSLFTSASTTNLGVLSLTSALPVRSTAAGTLFNGSIALGSSDVGGQLGVGNGGTGATTLAGANIFTGSLTAAQVPYATAATTMAGSANFLWLNGSSILSVNGTINSTSSNTTTMGIGTTTPAVRFVLQNAAGTSDAMRIASSTGATLTIIDSSGHLQIGTTTMASNLSIQGTAGQTTDYFTVASSSGVTVYSLSPAADGGLVVASSTSNNYYFKVLSGGGIAGSSTAPSLSSCGTGTPTVNGDRLAGTVTPAAGSTGCTVTFVPAFTNDPVCTVDSQAATSTFAYTHSNTAIVVTDVGLGTTKFDYICVGHSE